jgi:hypothetical protein
VKEGYKSLQLDLQWLRARRFETMRNTKSPEPSRIDKTQLAA